MPLVDHSRLGIPHMADSDLKRFKSLGVLCLINIKLLVNYSKGVIFVCRPSVLLFIPNGIEVSSTNHQVFCLLDDEFRIYLHYFFLWTLGRDEHEIWHYIITPFRKYYQYVSESYQHI